MSCGCGCGGRCVTSRGCEGLGAPCRQMASTAAEEKRDMQLLNDKLASYIQRMRQLGLQADRIDPSAYHEAIRVLEAEIAKMRNLYDNELDKLRRELENVNRERSGIAANCTKIQTMAGDLQGRLASESDKASRAAEELSGHQRALAQREKELADLRAVVQALQAELDRLRPDHARVNKDYEDLKQRLEGEVQRRFEAEGKAKQWCDKVNFNANTRDQELNDLKERLKASNDIIVTLETKIRQLSQGDGSNMGALLQKLRDGTAAELRRYQQETETALSGTLGALKNQMDADARARDAVEREKVSLEETVRNLSAKISDLQGQLAGALQQKRHLEEALNAEKSRAQSQIRDLQSRLRELTDCVMSKMKECHDARDLQVSLKTEINSYKSLLEEEEKRLCTQVPPSSRSVVPPSGLRAHYDSTVAHGGTATNAPKYNCYPINNGPYQFQRSSLNFVPGVSRRVDVTNQFPDIESSGPYSKVTSGAFNAYRPSNQRPKSAWGYGRLSNI